MPEQAYGWTLKELGLFLEGVARRRRDGLDEAITAGWVAEYCSRTDRMPALPALIKELLPEAPEGPQEEKAAGMTPAQQTAYLLTWAKLLGATVIRRSPTSDPGRN